MIHAELLAKLLPPVSYDPNSTRLAAELGAEGTALDTVVSTASRVRDAITPFWANEMLPDWERVCGLVPAASATVQQRISAVLAKLAETGGLSIPYFIQLAASLGYTITITEPQPFRAGISRAGDRLYLWPDVLWYWRVNVHSSDGNAVRWRAGASVAGERLLSFGDPILESTFNDLKPADTFCDFAYLEG